MHDKYLDGLTSFFFLNEPRYTYTQNIGGEEEESKSILADKDKSRPKKSVLMTDD